MKKQHYKIIAYIFSLCATTLCFGQKYHEVWLEGEDSNVWHYSYGGGFWLAPLNIAVLSFHYNRSDVDSRFMIRMGHAF
ncbi:MAG: hypothetical protein AAF960_29345 [Bacteroidota bacterium]